MRDYSELIVVDLFERVKGLDYRGSNFATRIKDLKRLAEVLGISQQRTMSNIQPVGGGSE